MGEIGEVDGRLLGDDAALLPRRLALMALDHVHAGDERAVIARIHLQHFALLALVAACRDDDAVALSNLRGHLENLRRERDDLHLTLGAQFAGYRSEDARADGLALRIDQNGRVGVEADQASILPAHAMRRAHDDRLQHFAFFDAAARNGFLDAHHDRIADIGVAALRAAQHLDAHHPARALIVSDVKLGRHLYHFFFSRRA